MESAEGAKLTKQLDEAWSHGWNRGMGTAIDIIDMAREMYRVDPGDHSRHMAILIDQVLVKLSTQLKESYPNAQPKPTHSLPSR